MDKAIRRHPVGVMYVAALLIFTATAAFGMLRMVSASDPVVVENPRIPGLDIGALGPLTMPPREVGEPQGTGVVASVASRTTTTPHLRFQDEKQYMLELINQERREAGVPSVSAGSNNAAQIHAVNAITDCFSGHWGTDGLGSSMRYSLAGGHQSNGENVAGYNYCLTDDEKAEYRPIGSVQASLRQHMQAYMGSPGHKDNILYSWHRKVNLGLSWDTHQMWTVQHFEGDYVDCSIPPAIRGTTLTVNCTTKEVRPAKSLTQIVLWNPPPHELTRGQISRSYSYAFGRRVAYLRQKAGPGFTYSSDEVVETWDSGCTPYDIDPALPPPSSIQEASLQHSLSKLCEPTPQLITVPWIDGEKTISASSIELSFDLGSVLQEHGEGVYTVMAWGCSTADSRTSPCADDDTMVILEEAIFYGIDPPAGYAPGAPTPTPTPIPPAQLVAPTVPENFGASSTGESTIDLSWTPRDGIADYYVSKSLTGAGGSWSEVGRPAGTASTHRASELDCGTEYRFAIKARGDGRRYLRAWSPYAYARGTTADCSGDTTPSPTQTPAPTSTPTPTPTAVPTDDDYPALRALMPSLNCTQDDFANVYDGPVTLDKTFGPYVWAPNGRGWKLSFLTRWEKDSDYGDGAEGITCLTVLHDNLESAILDYGWDRLRTWTEGGFDLLFEKKVRDRPEMGDGYLAMQAGLGTRQYYPRGEGSLDRVELKAASSILQRGRVTVSVLQWVDVLKLDLSRPLRQVVPSPSLDGPAGLSERIDARIVEAFDLQAQSAGPQGLSATSPYGPATELRGR